MAAPDPFVEHPIPTVVGLFLLSAIIIALNLLAIVVFVLRAKSRYPVDYPLVSLLVANTLQGLITIPAYALKKWKPGSSSQQAIICNAFRFTYFLCAHASILSLLTSSCDRIIALYYALRYQEFVTKKRLLLVLIGIWMFVIAFDLIPFFPVNLTDSDGCHYVPNKQWSVTMHILLNIIPFPILILNSIFIVRVAMRHVERQKSINKEKSRSRPKRSLRNVQFIFQMKATQKVLLITGTYILCVGPACVYYLLVWLCPHCFSSSYKHHQQWVRFVVKLLVHSHALLSPIIFFWRSKLFRSEAKRVLSKSFSSSISSSKSGTGSQKSDARQIVTNNGSPKSIHTIVEVDESDSSCSSTPEMVRRRMRRNRHHLRKQKVHEKIQMLQKSSNANGASGFENKSTLI